jgi:hypothetical protein
MGKRIPAGRVFLAVAKLALGQVEHGVSGTGIAKADQAGQAQHVVAISLGTNVSLLQIVMAEHRPGGVQQAEA